MTTKLLDKCIELMPGIAVDKTGHRVVFMGTPQFALAGLQALLDTCRVVGVVTQPERPSGRGRQPHPSPVQALAARHSLPVLTPASLKDPHTQEQVRAWLPDVIVVAAFGMLLPPAVLDLPPAGCINVHASLLPRWRGAAPIAAAILAGDEITGITIMKMDVGLDSGPILRQASLAIAADDTQGSLTDRLSRLGADLLRETLPDWMAGRITPHPQDEGLVTWAPPLEKEQGRINWQEPAEHIGRRVRAFHPWPGTYADWRGVPLKILKVQALPEPEGGADLLPGDVIATAAGPAVTTGRGVLRLLEVQPPGKRPMPAADFARGARNFIGSRMG